MATKTFTNTGILKKASSLIFKKHICLIGEKGNGKTYGVTKFASDNKIPTVFLVGHEGVEARDMLGYIKPATDGAFTYKYGQLSQAFKMAQEKPTILIIDEMLRIPKHELSVLVGALTPDSDGNLNLNTGNSIKLGDNYIDEVVSIPAENLWVVATTNYGVEYGITHIEEALKDRFRFVYHELTFKEQKDIIAKVVADEGWDKNLTDKLLNLVKEVNQLVAEQKLGSNLNIRQIVECLTIPDDKTLVALAGQLVLLDQAICLLTDTGRANGSQQELYFKAIQDSLGLTL